MAVVLMWELREDVSLVFVRGYDMVTGTWRVGLHSRG